jgi:hypothetical protein
VTAPGAAAFIIANKQSDSPEAILMGEDGIDDFDNLWLYCAGWPGLTLMSKWCSVNKF